MKPLIAYADPSLRLKLIIKEETLIDQFGNKSLAYSLFIFPDNSEIMMADYLQDTLEIVKEQAKRDYNIPYSAWREYHNDNYPKDRMTPLIVYADNIPRMKLIIEKEIIKRWGEEIYNVMVCYDDEESSCIGNYSFDTLDETLIFTEKSFNILQSSWKEKP